MRFHDSVLLDQKIFSDDVGAPFSLNRQGRRLLNHTLFSLVIGSCNKAFYCRLDQDESTTPPFVFESRLKATENFLNVYYEIMLGDFQDVICIPPLVWVYDKQIFYYK